MNSLQTSAGSASLYASSQAATETNSSHSILVEAFRLLNAGLSVVPINADGSKSPVGKWGDYMKCTMTPEQAHQAFCGNVGIGIIGGAVSGNMETLDFDEPGLYEQFEAAAEDHGILELVKRLALCQTPSGGAHLRYRCSGPVERCQKLAMRVLLDEKGDPILEKGKPKTKTRIETKAEGGIAIAPGSPSSCHTLGLPYILMRGDLADIPVLMPDEVSTLHNLARIFNEYEEPERIVHAPKAKRDPLPGDGIRPGDDYNERGLADVLERLQAEGWRAKAHGDGYYLTRPGKTKCVSATLNIIPNCFYVFSSNAAPFADNTPYSLFAVYTLLEYGGDFSAAAGELSQQGYGTVLQRSEFTAMGILDSSLNPLLQCGDITTIENAENGTDERQHRVDVHTIQEKIETVPEWVLQTLGNLNPKVVDGRVCVSKNATPKDIVGGIRRLWRQRIALTIQANYAIGVLAASLDGREKGISRQDQIERYFKTVMSADFIRHCVGVARYWSPTMITMAMEAGFTWDKILLANDKVFTVADQQEFITKKVTVGMIKNEIAKRKNRPRKHKTPAQMIRELEPLVGIDAIKGALMALYPQQEADAPAYVDIDNANSYVYTNEEGDDFADEDCEAELPDEAPDTPSEIFTHAVVVVRDPAPEPASVPQHLDEQATGVRDAHDFTELVAAVQRGDLVHDGVITLPDGCDIANLGKYVLMQWRELDRAKHLRDSTAQAKATAELTLCVAAWREMKKAAIPARC